MRGSRCASRWARGASARGSIAACLTSPSPPARATSSPWRCAKKTLDTLFFSRRLLMEGETDLGLLVKNTLDAIDWDALVRSFGPSAVPERLRLPTRRSAH